MLKHKSLICNACGCYNLPNTCYCQKCGNYIATQRKPSFFEGLRLEGIAGMGGRGISIAPATSIIMEKGHKFVGESVSGRKSGSIVVPLDDGSWYCPDCGHYNRKHVIICPDCGKYI